ncbi:MAG TPA: dihydropteroate synthase [Candidatus Dormibacteraeota bacterium]|nr:dihydropteroate synthase [Candidatus Dormibacteraeota bacterium]
MDSARYGVRPLLPGPVDVLRSEALALGAGPAALPLLARHGSQEAFAMRGLAPDETRVLERIFRGLGGEVLSSLDGDRVLLLGPLSALGDLPARLTEWGRRTEALGAALQEALAGKGGAPRPVDARGVLLRFGVRTLVMGVVNVTPDSFSGDGLAGRDAEAVVATAVAMAEAGADLIDVGGESTRPHSVEVPAEEELARVLPVLRELAGALPAHVALSVDTRKARVAEAAIEAGVHVVNDVWGLRGDPDMPRVVAASPGCAVVCMHNQRGTDYPGDVVEAVAAGLRESLVVAEKAGIDTERVIVDPGLGFGKTPAMNLEVLRRLGELRGLARPVLVGISRKSTVGMLLGGAPPEQRLEGSLALGVLAAERGGDILRVHDVPQTVRALRAADAVIRGVPADLHDEPAPGPTG